MHYKLDVQSTSGGTKPRGFYGSKSEGIPTDVEGLAQILIDHNYIGVHEWLVGDQYRPYCDIDYEMPQETTKPEFEEARYQKFKEVRDTLAKLFPSNDDIALYCASSFPQRKISGHFIVQGLYYREKDHIRYILEKGCDVKKLNMDMQVYEKNHCFRVPLATKPNSNRFLIPAEIKEIADVHAILKMDMEEARDEVVDQLMNGLITFTFPEDEEMPTPNGYTKPAAIEDEEEVHFTDYKGPPLSMDEIQQFLSALKPERFQGMDGRGPRRAIAHAISRLGTYQKIDLLDVMHQFFQRVEPGYEKEKYTRVYNAPDPKFLIDFRYVFKLAYQDDPTLKKHKVRYQEGRTVPETYYDLADQITFLQQPNLTVQDVEDRVLGHLAFVNDTNAWYVRFRHGWKENPDNTGSKKAFPYKSDTSSAFIMVAGPDVVDKEDKTKKKKIPGPDLKLEFSAILKALMSKPVFKQCCYSTSDYVPYFKTKPTGIWNEFQGWLYPFTEEPISSSDPDLAPVFELLNDLCGRSPATFKYFMSWLATCVQKPMEKMPFILLYSKVQGCGKSILEEFLTEYVFGQPQCLGTTDPSIIIGHFNAASSNTQMFFLQELKGAGAGGQHDYNAIKELVTNKKITKQKKFAEAAKGGKNYGKFIIPTNFADVFAIEPSDRRGNFWECDCSHVGDFDYYKRLTDHIFTPEVGAKTLSYLAQYDLTGFCSQNIPMTDLKESVKVRSMPSSLQHIAVVCEGKRQWNVRGARTYISAKELYADYEEFCAEEGIRGKYAARTYKEHMHLNLGFPAKPRQLSAKEDPHRPYAYLFDYDVLDQAFRSHLKRTTTIFDPVEPVEDEANAMDQE